MMGTTTGIAWTDHTFNPWWGCTRVSAGCQHCYAETLSIRTGHGVWGANAPRRRFAYDSKHWQEPLRWEKAAASGVPGPSSGRPDHLVFCASMADVFEDRDDHVDDRAYLFDLIGRTPHLTWQLLTKRPENVARMVPSSWMTDPPKNWWQGVTTEDQQRADERIPILLSLPAPVRFLSCEPLLGPVDLRPWLHVGFNAPEWVIVGGESGPGHRPMDLDHARRIRDDVRAAAVPLFFKQVGGHTPRAGGDQLDGVTIKEFPMAGAFT